MPMTYENIYHTIKLQIICQQETLMPTFRFNPS